jgi:hypothetical protein
MDDNAIYTFLVFMALPFLAVNVLAFLIDFYLFHQESSVHDIVIVDQQSYKESYLQTYKDSYTEIPALHQEEEEKYLLPIADLSTYLHED